MGNSESPISKIRTNIEQLRNKIPTGRFFEFGVDQNILKQVESYLKEIHTLMNELNRGYISKPIGDIKYYSDAATALRNLQEFVKEVWDKEGGSKEYTSRIRTLIDELDISVAILAKKKPLGDLKTKKPTNKIAGIALTSSVISDHHAPHQENPLSKSRSVFISYAWGDEREEIVNQIDQSLQNRGLKIIRDKRDLDYKGSIREFMERIGRGDCVIVVVSDKYLRSPNCMFELVEIAENKHFHDRIFPVVLVDADIYKPVKQMQYIKYWEDQIKELKETLMTIDPTHLEGIYEQLNLYDRIRDNISRLTAILSDMNTLTPEMHRESDFSHLYDAIEKRMNENLT